MKEDVIICEVKIIISFSSVNSIDSLSFEGVSSLLKNFFHESSVFHEDQDYKLRSKFNGFLIQNV